VCPINEPLRFALFFCGKSKVLWRRVDGAIRRHMDNEKVNKQLWQGWWLQAR